MENIVSARRLRKSALKNINVNNLNNIDNINMLVRSKSLRRSNKEKSLEGMKKIKINMKSKIIIKIFFSTLLIFTALVCKLAFKEKVLSNNFINKIVYEYNKDWSKEYITEKIEKYSVKIYDSIKYVIPQNFKNYIVDKYNNVIKPEYLKFNLYNIIKSSFKETQVENIENLNEEIKIEEKEEIKEEIKEENGIGGAEPIVEEILSTVSSISNDVEEIKSKNISIVSPTKGTITSIYGAREEIFEGVNSYHTGVDIANKKGTIINSATDGNVVEVVYNNKYYGNYVEVEIEGVIFKYAHMDTISVTKDSNIKQGDIIGYMGSTGMSTGPHLHFEIKINSRTVDPQELVSL